MRCQGRLSGGCRFELRLETEGKGERACQPGNLRDRAIQPGKQGAFEVLQGGKYAGGGGGWVDEDEEGGVGRTSAIDLVLTTLMRSKANEEMKMFVQRDG